MGSSIYKRVLIVLYAGDYYDAYHRLKNGLGEAYHHHNYALNSISQFSQQDSIEEVAVLGCATKKSYNHFIELGFRVMGAGVDPYQNPNAINKIIADYKPTHIVLRAPIPSILKWAIKNRVKTITLLADSFNSRDIKSRVKSFQLARLLNDEIVEWVGNHHINSCISLKKIGVTTDKIIPWDWPRESVTPADFQPKSLDNNRSSFNSIYVGSISEDKGVGDIIEAIAILKTMGVRMSLQIFGRLKNIEHFQEKIETLNLKGDVIFQGLVPNEKVVYLMRESDIVFVPSRHCYGEGMPSTIYEALCARTPIVASDHPMFLSNIENRYSALTFPEKQPQLIAECVQKLLQNPDLYFKLSQNSYEAWQKLQIPMKWADLVANWIKDTQESQQWISKRCLAADIYAHRLEKIQ